MHDEYDFIVEKLKEAGEHLQRVCKEGLTVTSKGGDAKNLLTNADTAVSDFLTAAIRASYPSARIYSEEATSTESVYDWVIDPIDGTANFSRGIPHYAICLAHLRDGAPVVGGVYNPVTEELFSFSKGAGAYLNGKHITVSPVRDMALAHVFFHAGRAEALREWGGESYRRLLSSVRKTGNYGGAALDTCFVAAGRIEANVYGTLSTLDAAPALGLLAEAGGVYSTSTGAIPVLSPEAQTIFMANSEEMLLSIRTLLV